MESITIFYGPKNDFIKKIPNSNTITLTEIVHQEDSERRIMLIRNADHEQEKIEKQKIENLIAYTDEYSGVTEHVILNFSNFLNHFEISNLFLQNPPLSIHKELEKIYSSILKVNNHKYSTLNLDRLKSIEDSFQNKIIGQPQVISQLIYSLYPLTRKKPHEPITLLFYGPTGVGKTETAKHIANSLGENLFRKQLSMFQNNEFSNYLFGGKYNQNSFSKDLLERESNVILLDEFDKANSIFHSAFYQIFDEGVFVDSNYQVDVKNSIIICTCNYTSEKEIKKHLGEPIFYRFNSIIEFIKLDPNSLSIILKQEIQKQYSELLPHEKKAITIDEVTDKILPHAAKLGNARQIRKNVKLYFSKLLYERANL